MVVLIVDDSRVMRRLHRTVVQQLGDVEILEAGDGVSAIYQMKNNNFKVDLILLDWVMPRMDGLSLVKHLKGHPHLAKIPVLMVTSQSEEHLVREAWRTGVDGYLLKPFTKEMLLRAILSLSKEGKKRIMDERVEEKSAPATQKPFMETLPRAAFDRIMALAQMDDLKKGDIVLDDGDLVEFFQFIVNGKVIEASDDAVGPGTFEYTPGDCFAVTELMSGGQAGSRFRAAEKTRVGRIPKYYFEGLLMEFPELSVGLSRYLADRAQQIGEQREEAGSDDALSGTLDVLDLPDLIQAINLRQKTGVIEFPGMDAELSVNCGQIVAATCDGEEGEEAFFSICARAPQRFKFTRRAPDEENIEMNTTMLLLEWCRRSDEGEA